MEEIGKKENEEKNKDFKKLINFLMFARVAELADALASGSGGKTPYLLKL